MDNEYAIILENVSKKYRLYNKKQDRMKEALHPLKKKFHKDFYAVKDLNLKVKKGEILGIVGRNGSGKSTTLKMISDIIKPTSGKIITNGNIVPLLDLGGGFNPDFTGIENIYFYCSMIGISRKETANKLKEIIDFAEIGDHINQPIKTYSSGMKARLAFAVSINVDPDILILDEVLSVGDELFKRKSFLKMEEFFKTGKTILFVSHAANSIVQLCNRAIILERGEIIQDGQPKDVIQNYHKLLYAKQHEVERLKDKIRKENENFVNDSPDIPDKEEETKKQDTDKIKKAEEKKQKAYFIPNFNAKSKVVVESNDLELNGFKITTLDDEKVNVLVQNEEYLFSYNLKFKSQIDNISFGMSIRTEKSLNLSSMRWTDENKSFKNKFNKGDEINIKWKFKCIFQHGNYYLNTSIARISNLKYAVQYAISDALVFKVLKNTKNLNGGFVMAIEDMHITDLSQVK